MLAVVRPTITLPKVYTATCRYCLTVTRGADGTRITCCDNGFARMIIGTV